MLRFMLCGASDTKLVSPSFRDIAKEFGADSMYYQDGTILHLNHVGSSWAANSRRSVSDADVCVFVVLENYGEITWTVELQHALEAGVPFIILCLSDTYDKYTTLRNSLENLTAVKDPDERNLVESLADIETLSQLTIVPFQLSYFSDILRKQISELMRESLTVLRARTIRTTVFESLGTSTGTLSDSQRTTLIEAALDESEAKTLRKRAIERLADSGGLALAEIRALVVSMEQGVQRLTVSLLPQLCAHVQPDVDFFEFCVDVANSSDDVGVSRRLVSVVLELDLELGLLSLGALTLHEDGTRRRLAEAIRQRESLLVDTRTRSLARELALRCVDHSHRDDWKAECRDLCERLTSPPD